MKKLSIFVDESGNFGLSKQNSSIYIFTLVLHDNLNELSTFFKAIERELRNVNEGNCYIHTYSLIRKRDEYKDLDISKRRKILNIVSHFVNNMPIWYLCIKQDKKNLNDENQLSKCLEKNLMREINNNLNFFLDFDLVTIYYDNGQKQLRDVLQSTFRKKLKHIVFEVVNPRDYLLFQVADYISTLELINIKYETNRVNLSEQFFFGTATNFKKNYYRNISKKKVN